MLLKKINNIPAEPVTMPGARGATLRILVGRGDGAPTFAMRLFELEPGGQTPLHAHNYEHEVLILEGQGQVTGGLDGSTIRPVEAGDVVLMPANEKHQFRNTAERALKFICLVPVSFDCGQGQCQPTPGT